MWIESQDKKSLLKSKGVTIELSQHKSDVTIYTIVDIQTKIVLGVYLNKSLVSQIFDEIKTMIVSEFNYGHTIYSMPLDRA